MNKMNIITSRASLTIGISSQRICNTYNKESQFQLRSCTDTSQTCLRADLRYRSYALCSALTKDNLRALRDVFGPVHPLKSYNCTVSSAQDILVGNQAAVIS